MKTQDFVKEESDRNNPLKKLADKIVSRSESTVNSRLGVVIDWSKGTMLLEPVRK